MSSCFSLLEKFQYDLLLLILIGKTFTDFCLWHVLYKVRGWSLFISDRILSILSSVLYFSDIPQFKFMFIFTYFGFIIDMSLSSSTRLRMESSSSVWLRNVANIFMTSSAITAPIGPLHQKMIGISLYDWNGVWKFKHQYSGVMILPSMTSLSDATVSLRKMSMSSEKECP